MASPGIWSPQDNSHLPYQMEGEAPTHSRLGQAPPKALSADPHQDQALGSGQKGLIRSLVALGCSDPSGRCAYSPTTSPPSSMDVGAA